MTDRVYGWTRDIDRGKLREVLAITDFIYGIEDDDALYVILDDAWVSLDQDDIDLMTSDELAESVAYALKEILR